MKIGTIINAVSRKKKEKYEIDFQLTESQQYSGGVSKILLKLYANHLLFN